MKIKAVIFDIDGTLYRSREYVKQLVDAMCDVISELLSIPRERAWELYQSIRSKIGTISLGLREIGIDRRRFYRELVKKLDPSQSIRPRPELKRMLEEIRRMGLKVGCHTNSSRELAKLVLNALGLDLNDLDILITSDDAEPKPMPDGYLKIIDQLGLEPRQVLYVGDRWRIELETAKKLGMKTVLVSSKLDGDPDLVIGDVLELLEKLRSLKDP
ncbi:MAG: HAD family hydrolase [Thaumarchaeota archaeon]|nr:HAD family hydrolase [Nitrososphaerota archaeon]